MALTEEPQPPQREDLEPHITPRMWLDYHLQARGLALADVKVNRVVLVAFMAAILNRLVFLTSAQRPKHEFLAAFRRLYSCTYGGKELSIAEGPLGAPAAVIDAEELIARGGEVFIIIGAAGSLQPNLPIGSVVVPSECIADEGTSRHYLAPGAVPRPSDRLVGFLMEACQERGIEVQRGLHWTTDARYRVLKGDVRRRQGNGVLSVESEVSALFSVAMHRGVEAAAILVISDELFRPWAPAFFAPEFTNSMAQVCEAALEAASRA